MRADVEAAGHTMGLGKKREPRERAALERDDTLPGATGTAAFIAQFVPWILIGLGCVIPVHRIFCWPPDKPD